MSDEQRVGHDRAEELSRFVNGLGEQIVAEVKTVGEAMYVAHALYDAVLFNAIEGQIEKKLRDGTRPQKETER